MKEKTRAESVLFAQRVEFEDVKHASYESTREGGEAKSQSENEVEDEDIQLKEERNGSVMSESVSGIEINGRFLT